MHIRVFMAAASLAVVLAACATIVKGTTQIIAVNTPGVPGASCTLTSPAIGSRLVITPGTVTVEKSKDPITVRCTKECYIEGAGIIASNFQAMTAGNIIAGGVIGLGVDAASGAMNEYAPEVQILMQPDPTCRVQELPARRVPRR
jgi:hypothetical protein